MSLCQPSGLCAHPCGGLSFAMDSSHHGSGFWAQVGLRAYPVPPVTRGPPACEHLSCCGHRKGLDVPPGHEVPNSRNRSVSLCPPEPGEAAGPSFLYPAPSQVRRHSRAASFPCSGCKAEQPQPLHQSRQFPFRACELLGHCVALGTRPLGPAAFLCIYSR